MIRFPLSLVVFLSLALGQLWGQSTVVTGVVWDDTYDESMALSKVYFKGTDKATITDFDGLYRIELTGQKADTLVFESVGYATEYRAVRPGETQTINVGLSEVINELEEAVIEGRENPAFPIIRKSLDRKGQNDLRRLEASYSQESYNRLELYLTSLSEGFKDRKAMKQLREVLGENYLMVDSAGNERLPVYLSETISELHWQMDPQEQKEIVRATRITGVGVSDGSLVSQMVGASFHLYNFYDNWVNILEKEFVSPLAESWRTTYWYILEDSLTSDSQLVYRISFEPKRPSELAFTGTMWIDGQTYGLQRMRVGISPDVNLNWLDTIGFDLTYAQSPGGATFVETSDIEIKLTDLGGATQAVVVHARQENNLMGAGEPFPRKFFDVPIEVDPESQDRTPEYWAEKLGQLTEAEEELFARIDTLKELPVVRSYIEIANTIIYGFKKLGPVEVGPYAYLLALNDIEGVRMRIGLRTNEDFSKKFEVGAFGAYGTKDVRWKGDGYAKWIPSKRRWTEVEWNSRHDLDRLGLTGRLANPLNEAAARWGIQRGGYYHTRHRFSVLRQVSKSLELKVAGQWRFLDPQFDFAYQSGVGERFTSITTSELVIEATYAWHRLYLRNGNRRLDLGPDKGPELKVTYTRGLKGVLGGQFDYNKLDVTIEQDVPMGKLGQAKYVLGGGQVFDPVPYPLLEVHLGNNSPFYNYLAFNLLRPFELVSDRYASFQYIHHFEGLILSRIPVLRRTNWRLVANYSALVGEFNNQNRVLTATDVPQLGGLSETPYMEVGYGIENIFRLLRVQVFHRLTYRDGPDPRNWGVLGTIQLVL